MAREWFGNGIAPPVDGRLEFIQDTSMSVTHSLVELNGMEGHAHSYHVHLIPVQPMLQFPCTGDAVGGHFNPWEVDSTALIGITGINQLITYFSQLINH